MAESRSSLNSAKLVNASNYFGLDALRGVAAVAVMLFHASEVLGVRWLGASGYLAVDLFFVMSGFVIAHAYERRIPHIGANGFLTLRLIRFLPLFYLGGVIGLIRLAALVVVTGSEPDVSVAGAVAYFFFFPAPPDASLTRSFAPLNGPGWSLLFELWINVVYALLLRFLTTRVLTAIVGAAGVGLLASFLSGESFGLAVHWGGTPLTATRVIFSFSCGVVLYRKRDLMPRSGLSNPALAAGLAVLLSIPSNLAFDYAFVLIMSPLIVALAVGARRPDRLARYGATSSYAIYAIHSPLVILAVGVSNRLGLPVGLFVGATMATVLIAAPVLDRRFDMPCRRWLTARFVVAGSAPFPPATG